MKTISILGACVSRELFNDIRLVDEFKINTYAFQTNLWDMLSPSLEMDEDIINRIPIENFTRRNIGYDINKNILQELIVKKSDYIIIDLYNLCNVCLKISTPHKTVYMKTLRTEAIFSSLKTMGLNYSFELLNFEDIDKDIIKNGLIKLADWLKQHYNQNQIILHYPIFCERYYDINGELQEYLEPRKSDLKKMLKQIHEYTDILAKELPECRLFKPVLNHIPTARLRVADNINHSGVPVHYTNEDANSIVSQFIDLLDLKLQNNINEFDLLAKDCLKMSNLASKLNDKINMTNSAIITNLNYFVANRINYDECVVFVVSKNQAADKLHKFFNKNKMGLNLNIVKSQSYVGVVDKSAQFVFEKASYEKVSYQYDFAGNKVELVSDYKTNANSIMINGKEFSQNRRGLNFVVFNKKLNKVEHAFVCDTYADDLMLIRL